MKVTRTSETTPGPAEWFTGAVFLDTAAAPGNGARISASNVHFTPGARTAWHRHPHGQSPFVLEGVGLAAPVMSRRPDNAPPLCSADQRGDRPRS